MKDKTKYYGIVEGFFGRPLRGWTWKERFKTLKFINKYAGNINAYFYCPKDDIYVTERWNCRYPKAELKKLAKYIKYCKNNNIKFIYGFNPQIENVNNWLRPTYIKIKQLISVGVEDIALIFDDIPLAYDVLDNNLTKKSYENYVNSINKTYITFKKVLKEFWICTPDYFFNKETALTKSLLNLDKNIGVMWSGPEIFVKNIYKRDIFKLENVLGKNRKIILWFNYPVNDCEQNINTFNLGGFPKIDRYITNKLFGIFANPMRECYSNLPFYQTLSDYIINPQRYNRAISWKNALKVLLKTNDFKKYIKIINSFLSPNRLDQVSKFVTPTKKISLEMTGRIDNLYGRLFLNTIKSIFTEYRIYMQIYAKLGKSIQIPSDLFEKYDWFPTNPNVSRYLPEIYDILTSKYQVYQSYTNSKASFIKMSTLVDEYKSKYFGRKKLKISNSDNKKYLRAINKFIYLERVMFLTLINSVGISTNKKLELLYKRRRINRFTTTKKDLVLEERGRLLLK